MNYREIFEGLLNQHTIVWCRGTCDLKHSHKRGFAVRSQRCVHLVSEVSTRAVLHRALHEIGHILNDETGMRRFEKEHAANRFAESIMRENAIVVPRRVSGAGARYVRRMKRWGSRIRAGLRGAE